MQTSFAGFAVNYRSLRRRQIRLGPAPCAVLPEEAAGSAGGTSRRRGRARWQGARKNLASSLNGVTIPLKRGECPP